MEEDDHDDLVTEMSRRVFTTDTNTPLSDKLAQISS
jgi:hypothetical protein